MEPEIESEMDGRVRVLDVAVVSGELDLGYDADRVGGS